MTPEERKAQFLDVAAVLWQQRVSLERLAADLTLNCDQRALRSILTDLDWAVENCHVIGRHQIGEALDDQMGYDEVWPIRQQTPPGKT